MALKRRTLFDAYREGNDFAVGMKKVREAWKRYRANCDFDRNAIYEYLEVVFKLVQKWKKRGVAEKYSLKALKEHELPGKLKADPYARIIYCTSNADPKARSKWAGIMQWVAKHNKNQRSFTEFVTKNGGLNKCAEGWDPEWT